MTILLFSIIVLCKESRVPRGREWIALTMTRWSQDRPCLCRRWTHAWTAIFLKKRRMTKSTPTSAKGLALSRYREQLIWRRLKLLKKPRTPTSCPSSSSWCRGSLASTEWALTSLSTFSWHWLVRGWEPTQHLSTGRWRTTSQRRALLNWCWTPSLCLQEAIAEPTSSSLMLSAWWRLETGLLRHN